MDSLLNVKNLAQILKCAVKCGEPMSRHTSFKIGGNAELYIEVKKPSQLSEIIKECNRSNTPYLILGRGSNLLVSDSGIKGVVISLQGDFKRIDILDQTSLYCGSGVSLARLCTKALSCNLSGLEFAWGIPGSAGGATFMNAGAYGGEMKDVIYSVTHMTRDGNIETLKGGDLNFSYRSSVYRENGCIILGITLQLKTDNPVLIRDRMDDYMARRKEKQPLDFPSAGSVFKRPRGAYAGTLIEQCGLKGKTIGGAQISEKHAGFIINKGNATCQDVCTLIKTVQDKVKQETGYSLEREIILLD